MGGALERTVVAALAGLDSYYFSKSRACISRAMEIVDKGNYFWRSTYLGIFLF